MEENTHSRYILEAGAPRSSRSDRVCHMPSLLLNALHVLFFMGFLLEVPDISSSYIK